LEVAFSDCSGNAIRFNGMAGKRIAFDTKDVTFESHGVKLTGRLVMPLGTGKVPVVVLIHGAETDSALTFYFLQRMLPAEGIGAFIFDKRGTGISGGKYTQDFDLLADDDVAAMQEARKLAGPRLGRIGYQGGSEAGWTEPLAVNRAPVDFAIVCFGLAVNVMDEDQESIELQMREKGYPQETITKALEVGRVAEHLFATDFKRGYREFDEVRARYGKEPWFKDVRGDFSWLILSHTDDQLRAMAKPFDWHTPVHYDGMQTLRADKVPQLWIVGGEDYEAPAAETSMRVKSLIADGLPFTLAYYPHAEHGMTLFEAGADGSRESTVYAPGYFRMLRDYARGGRLAGQYGDAMITYPRARPDRLGPCARGSDKPE
jgi:pimeloyl-ACP methyl ester carboxylesterase